MSPQITWSVISNSCAVKNLSTILSLLWGAAWSSRSTPYCTWRGRSGSSVQNQRVFSCCWRSWLASLENWLAWLDICADLSLTCASFSPRSCSRSCVSLKALIVALVVVLVEAMTPAVLIPLLLLVSSFGALAAPLNRLLLSLPSLSDATYITLSAVFPVTLLALFSQFDACSCSCSFFLRSISKHNLL